MNILEAFYISLDSIWSNKMRSILTMLGLIIGISSVVTIVSLGNATQDSIEENLSSLGLNSITVSYSREATIAPADEFTYSDIKMIEENFEDEVAYVIPTVSASGTILNDVSETGISFKASVEKTETAENLTMTSGRFLNEFDFDGYKKNIVIDSDLSEELFPDSSSIGQKIMIKIGNSSQAFLVVGVYEKEETLGGFSLPSIYLPYTSMNMIFNLNNAVDSLSITFNDTVEDPSTEVQSVISALERSNNNLGESKYDTFSAEEMIETVTDTLGMVTLFIGAIAAISLVVGGIGVMNIMLVSVTERTREIGTRKALGAQYRDIMLQFLIESVTIAVLGGIIGSLLGGILTTFGGNLMGMNATISMNALMLAVVFSTSIGIFFGLYPANKAAKLNPIEALRHE